VFESENRAWACAWVSFVHEDGTVPEYLTISFEDKINDSLEERMSRANERSKRFAREGDQIFFEGNALVAAQDGLADSDEPIPLADGSGYVRDFVATGLALVDRAAQAPECFQEERFDVVGLEPSGCGTF
jgi:hypothetical protein